MHGRHGYWGVGGGGRRATCSLGKGGGRGEGGLSGPLGGVGEVGGALQIYLEKEHEKKSYKIWIFNN